MVVFVMVVFAILFPHIASQLSRVGISKLANFYYKRIYDFQHLEEKIRVREKRDYLSKLTGSLLLTLMDH